MSPSSSISSFEPRRGLRQLLAAFGLTCCIWLGVTGLTYWQRGLVRHPQDIELTQIATLSGSYDRLILSDSVTENATTGLAFPPGTYPLMTHGWMRLAGQVLLMERVLQRVDLKHVDLFIEPDLLLVEVNDEEGEGRIRHTYTDTLFTSRAEIAELRAAGDLQAGASFPWFELFYKSLQPGPRELPVRDRLWAEAPRPDRLSLSDVARQAIERRRRDMATRPVTEQNRYFLRRFAEICRQRHLVCRTIVEPMPVSLPRLDRSLLTRLMPDVEVFDINDVALFPDGAFHDGWHLHQPDWTAYYQTLLSSQGLMQFARRLPMGPLPVWDGRPLSFAQDRLPARLAQVYPPEPWGRWTEGERAALQLHIDPQAARGRHLVLDATALVRKGPQELRLMLDDRPLCGSRMVESGDVTLVCPLPDDLGDTLNLTVETSYATSPQEFGEADGRNLGIGLRQISMPSNLP